MVAVYSLVGTTPRRSTKRSWIYSGITKHNNTKMKTRKTKQLIELMRFSVAGVQYSDYQCVLGLKPGRKVSLVWERSNPFDNMAIRLDVNGVKIGYVPRSSFQVRLHELRCAHVRLYGTVVAYNKTNPTWSMITVAVSKERRQSMLPSDPEFMCGDIY
jgi:hypothetical protein